MVSLTTTITTPTNFVEYAKSIDVNDPTRTFVENMIDESDVMRAIPIMAAERGKRAYMDIASLPTVGFRGLNEAGNQGLGSFNLREEDTFFIDDYIFADRAMIDRLGPEGKYKQEKLKSTALAQFFSQNVIKSDNSANVRTPERHAAALLRRHSYHRQFHRQQRRIRRRRAVARQPRQALLAGQPTDALDHAARVDAAMGHRGAQQHAGEPDRLLRRGRCWPPHHQVQGPADLVRLRARRFAGTCCRSTKSLPAAAAR